MKYDTCKDSNILNCCIIILIIIILITTLFIIIEFNSYLKLGLLTTVFIRIFIGIRLMWMGTDKIYTKLRKLFGDNNDNIDNNIENIAELKEQNELYKSNESNAIQYNPPHNLFDSKATQNNSLLSFQYIKKYGIIYFVQIFNFEYI